MVYFDPPSEKWLGDHFLMITIPVLITPPIQSVQQPKISDHVSSIRPTSTRRPTAIFPISSFLLSLADPKWPLLLQF